MLSDMQSVSSRIWIRVAVSISSDDNHYTMGLSLPHVKKPFNSKVMKSFVPELRSRKVFHIFGFLCYLYMLMNIICTFHIFMYGHVTQGVKTMKGYSTLPKSSELEPHYKMQFSVIHKIPLFGEGFLSLCRGYSQHILSPVNSVGFVL